MPDPFADTIANRPRLLLCGAADDSVSAVLAGMAEQSWSPQGAALGVLSLSASWPLAAEEAGAAALEGSAAGVLIVARDPKAVAYRVEMRAENRAALKAGKPGRISPLGPAVVRTTAPVAEMVRAMQECGVAAAASSDPGDQLGAYLFYRLLAEGGDAGPTVALLHVPAAAHDLEPAVKAAAAAFARRLARSLSPA